MIPLLRLAASTRRFAAVIIAGGVALCVFSTSTSAQPATSGSVFQDEDLRAVVDAQVRRDAEPLITFLSDASAAVRAQAALALGSVQDSAAIPVLVERLTSDPSPDVQIRAAFALGQTPGSVPTAPLFATLSRSDRQLDLRRAALEALGKTGDAASLRQLAELDVDADLEGDRALAIARYGLRNIHDSLAVNRLLEILSVADARTERTRAAYYFGRMTTTTPWSHQADAVRSALQASAPGDPAVMHLVRGVSRLSDPADDGMLFSRLRTSPDWRTRVNTARALANRTGRASVVAALTESLSDSIPHVAITAAEVLSGATVAPSQSEALIEWIQQSPDRWRVAAPLLQCIARSADDPVGRPFVRNMVRRYGAQRNPVVYAAAVPALAHLKTSNVPQALTAAATNDDPRIAASALSALSDRWDRLRRKSDGIGPARTSRYFEAFASGVFRGDVATINAAASALADSAFATNGATGILIRALNELDMPEDIEGITSLFGAIGTAPPSPQAETALRNFLDHPHPVLRQTAASALTTYTGEPVLPTGSEIHDAPPVDWDVVQTLGNRPRLTLETSKGQVVIEMNPESAPQTVTTIAQLAADGEYDDVPFHRVVPNFVVQGGDVARGDGWGGPGFMIRSEFTRIPYARGTVGVASAGKDTEGSQFFITHSIQPHLDGRYTAFGRVVEGMDVVDQLLENDTITTATVE
jgi:cyclophilin family peptidyl-prolyl cis-trans isomerase/HEAT repeat protein